jgi:hypothetical protein
MPSSIVVNNSLRTTAPKPKSTGRPRSLDVQNLIDGKTLFIQGNNYFQTNKKFNYLRRKGKLSIRTTMVDGVRGTLVWLDTAP